MPPPHSTSSCSTSLPSEETKTFRSSRARADASATLTSGRASARSASQAEVDLLVERDRERIDLHARLEAAALRLDRSEILRAAARRARERAGAKRCVACAVARQAPVGREAPGAADEHADADPFALGVAERLDVPVLRGNGLGAPIHAARIGVRSSGGDGGVDCIGTEIAHGR